MRKAYVSALTKLKLRFKNELIEKNYHVLMQPFNHVNFMSFLILLLAGQLGFLAVKLIEKDTNFAILIGITVIINLFLFLNRKKLYKALEIIVMVFMAFLYVLGIFDLKGRVEKDESQSSRLFVFFEGYLLSLVHQLFLRYFVEYSFLFLFDIGAMLLRCIIFGPLMLEGQFPFPVLIHILFDLAILHVSYRKEVTDRGLFEQLHNQKEELAKFKSLMVDSMPENIMIINASLTQELFINQAFRKNLRRIDKQGNFEEDLSKIYVMKESLETLHHTPNLEEMVNRGPNILNLLEFIKMGTKCETFENDVFILQGTSTPPDPEKTPIGRRTYEIKIFRLYWDGETALTVILSDITHRETLVALQLSDLNKDKVLSSVTHELKTPLNGIQGMIQIMQKSTENPETLFHLNICRSSADLLLHYINSIWDLQLLRKEKLKVRAGSANIRELIQDIEDLFIIQCHQKRLDLNFNVSDEVPEMIYTDKDRLSEVLVHLVSNAIKFTFKGQVKLNVTVVENNKDLLLFTVTDTGIGLSEKDRIRLFKMYGRLDSNVIGTKGVGLGLTTSNGIIAHLNGQRNDRGIFVESELSKGSTFSFMLPVDIHQKETTKKKKRNKRSKKVIEDQKVVTIGDQKTTEGELLKNNRKTEELKYTYEEDAPEDENSDDEDFEEDDDYEENEDDFKELGEIEDVGDELVLDSDLNRFVGKNGLSVVQKNVKRYKTKTVENLCKWSESDSARFSSVDEGPQSQRSLIKIPLMGFSNEISPLGSAKITRKNTVTFKPPPPKYQKRFESADSFLRISTKGLSESPLLRHQQSSENHTITASKVLLKTLSLNHSIKKYEKYQSRAKTYELEDGEPRERILVVDDMPYNLVVAEAMIEKAGYQVVTAMHGQDAIDVVKEFCQKDNEGFKLILMDLQMPVMDGFAATSKLVEMMNHKEIPFIPIVALTANNDDENATKCKECGMKDFLKKPLKIKDLEKVLKSVHHLRQNDV